MLAAAVLLGVNLPPALGFVARRRHEQVVNSLPHLQQHGRWDVVDVPAADRVNAIHGALLPTGRCC